jgi:tetratricopeptide (TPR) repeat protein
LYAQTKNSRALKVADILINQYKLKSEKDGLFIKGFYYTNINEKEKSIEYFNKVLALNYTYMEAYREKALALYSMQKFSEALAVLDKAVTLQNNFDEGFYYKGMVLEKLNRPEDAKEAYKRALIYDTGYVEAKAALKRLTLNNK